ncbi:hypothetical protein MPER_12248, partial [Moniliophthora perniciosa FA553]
PDGSVALTFVIQVQNMPRGNNIVVVTNDTNTFTPTNESAPGLIFSYTYDDSVFPHEGENVDASRTQAFYLGNKVHDLLYRYGFTEDAFNFQNTNFGKGSARRSIARMPYVPLHHHNGIDTLHEITHGLTVRMTGGGTARCLQTAEAGGLGEGWSDAFADWTEHQSGPDVKDFVTGAYVLDNPGGVREFPYSTNATVNPLRYSSIESGGEVHSTGEIWANLLHNVYAALVAEHGWSSTAFTDPTGLEGNVVYLHLFVDALAIQPCNPTFVDARDSWIQADEDRYDGVHKCLLWKTFASRGLGVNAADYQDDETIPEECQVDVTVDVNVTVDL